MGTGWFAAKAARAGPGKTVAVVGDGAVGLLGVPVGDADVADVPAGSGGADGLEHRLLRADGDIVTERGDDCSSPTSTCTAGPPRYASTCPS
ncbi:hypothetical protein OG318_50410 [Streptomyces sp. NBC_01483]|nr:hypothetical protein [Streptomyces sp. NBC_01483]